MASCRGWPQGAVLMGQYAEELTKAMTWLGEQPDTFFLGQAVECKGTAMTGTLEGVPEDKKLELPVFEETQMGMTTGLALAGFVPISIYPRWNFLLCATNQLVNHVDKLCKMGPGFNRKIIIRTGIGAERPIHPQHQHVGDFTEAFRLMCPNINIIRLEEPEDVVRSYKEAYASPDPTVVVEYGDSHGEK